ncbi:MAG: hypothetical protein KAS32_01095 [Candidatus Peribacteraceae bacterium]|nr:hypothetical protein [Candidatus Peribacteraceae bacterium]
MFNNGLLSRFKEWKHSPIAFVKDVIDVTPSAQQLEYLYKVARERRITIRSGHGTGKDASTAWVIMWFMCTRAFAKVVCTAPTARQLDDVLWSELSKWLRKSKVTDEFIIQKNKIFQKNNPKEWWCRAVSASARSTKEEQAETLQGFHGEHLLIIVDEASGVVDPVYIPLEGALTQEDNKVVLIGNMTKNKGYFYDSHFHNAISKRWCKLHWDSRDSTNVGADYPEYMLEKYGEDSNVFRIRVAGDPPTDDEKTFIPLSWAQQCIGVEYEDDPDAPLYLSIDVARYGEDKSIVLPRRGLIIKPWEEHQKMSTAELGGHVLADFREMKADGIAIDEIGVGAGTIDWLMKVPEAKRFVYGVNVANSSSDKKRYARLRDELWYRVREKCQQGMYSFPCEGKAQRAMSEELCNELSSLHYEFNNNGAYVLEGKKQAKMRGVISPNIGDALAISEYFYDSAMSLFLTKAKVKAKKRKIEELDKQEQNEHSWMVM